MVDYDSLISLSSSLIFFAFFPFLKPISHLLSHRTSCVLSLPILSLSFSLFPSFVFLSLHPSLPSPLHTTRNPNQRILKQIKMTSSLSPNLPFAQPIKQNLPHPPSNQTQPHPRLPHKMHIPSSTGLYSLVWVVHSWGKYNKQRDRLIVSISPKKTKIESGEK